MLLLLYRFLCRDKSASPRVVKIKNSDSIYIHKTYVVQRRSRNNYGKRILCLIFLQHATNLFALALFSRSPFRISMVNYNSLLLFASKIPIMYVCARNAMHDIASSVQWTMFLPFTIPHLHFRLFVLFFQIAAARTCNNNHAHCMVYFSSLISVDFARKEFESKQIH